MKKIVFNFLILSVMILISTELSGCGAKMNDNPFNFEGGKPKTTDGSINMDLNSPPPPSEENSNKDEMKKSMSPGGNTGDVLNQSDNTTPTTEKIDDSKEITEKVPSKIIKTADIRFQVKKYDDSRKKILDLVKQTGAYVQSENQTTSDLSVDNTIVIRIKSDGFDNLVEKLLEESIYVDSKKIVADDVTEQFVDVQARLKSKKEVEIQYLDLLKKARTINEILDVQQYIRTIREEIESFEGRLKYMNDRAAYSAINLTFYEKIPFTTAPSPENGFLYRIGNAFSGGWKVLLSLCVGIVALWPLWLISAIAIIVILRLVRRKKNKK